MSMLFNKDWEKPKATPQIDPLSFDDFIAWLETQHPRQTYEFTDVSNCLLAQWVQSIDPKTKSNLQVDNSWVYLVNGQTIDFHGTKFPRVASTQTDTFGEALAKARLLHGIR